MRGSSEPASEVAPGCCVIANSFPKRRLGTCKRALRRNRDSTEAHARTMLQACSQGVDLKVDRLFGEGHRYQPLKIPYSVPKNFVTKNLGRSLRPSFHRPQSQPSPSFSFCVHL